MKAKYYLFLRQAGPGQRYISDGAEFRSEVDALIAANGQDCMVMLADQFDRQCSSHRMSLRFSGEEQINLVFGK